MDLLSDSRISQTTSAKKAPYLSQFKSDIGAKQRQIRERLSISSKNLDNNSDQDDDNIPSIDGEVVEKQDFNQRYKAKLSYLEDNNSVLSSEKNNPYDRYKSYRNAVSKPLQEKKQYMKPRSLFELDSLPKKFQGLDRGKASSPVGYKSSDLDDLPPQPKLNYDRQDYLANIQDKIHGLTIDAQRKTRTTSRTKSPETDKALTKHQQQVVVEQPRPRQRSIEKIYADEIEKLKSFERQFTESPVRPDPNYFTRKPSNNSLLRAHDSIRLKTERRKVRPESEVLPNETELDGPISESHVNERAVDVKRDSIRGSKRKSKKQKEEKEELVPVRNFAEVRNVEISLEGENSLGVTVRVEDGNIVIARVLAGSVVDKQSSLRVGDIILAANNREVYTPEQLQEQLRKAICDKNVTLKIVPSYKEERPALCIYLRALFTYDANEDTLLPCKEVGVSFNQGDILEVVNQEDPNWWQARRVDSENLQTGLIPSQELEERRRAFVIPDFDLATRTSICGTKVSRVCKKKEIYNIGQNSDFDKAELPLYEEVCRTPAFERRTLVLIGANGVGRQALKARLIAQDPDRFGTPLPHTSRAIRDGEQDGVHYHFETREKMEEDIIAGKYLEFGEYESALYGTKLDSIREIIGSGKMCVLDCNATCLKILKTSDYLPFVIFIAAPTIDQLRYMHEWARAGGTNKTYATLDRAISRQSRRTRTLQDFAFDFFEDEDLQLTIEESARLFRVYENYFNLVLVNENFDQTYQHIRDAIDALSMAPQWIPISWIYGN